MIRDEGSRGSGSADGTARGATAKYESQAALQRSIRFMLWRRRRRYHTEARGMSTWKTLIVEAPQGLINPTKRPSRQAHASSPRLVSCQSVNQSVSIISLTGHCALPSPLRLLLPNTLPSLVPSLPVSLPLPRLTPPFFPHQISARRSTSARASAFGSFPSSLDLACVIVLQS